MKKNLLLYFALLFVSISYGQYANKHYIAPAPWQYWNQANEIVIGTIEPNTIVNVELRRSDGALVQTLSVTEDNPISYRFVGNIGTTLRNNTNVVYDDRGLIVTATHPVLINLRNIASDTSGSTVANIKGNASLVSFGAEGLGQEFRIGYYRSSIQGLDGGGPIYSVMATEDGTSVTLPTQTINLNQGQSYLFTAPMGSLVTSNKPIVMNVGSYGDTPQLCGAGGQDGQDGTFDQIAPIPSLGQKYMVVRGEGTVPNNQQQQSGFGPEQTTIVATEANTAITIQNFNADGTVFGAQVTVNLANAGNSYTFYHGNGTDLFSSSLIDSDKSIVVYSGTAVDCETDISTVLPIGGCAGAVNIQTKKFINYNSSDLPYFGFCIIESATSPVLINGQDVEVLTGVNRVAIGTSGFYLINFNNTQIANPANIILTSNMPLTTSLVQQGEGFSMSAFFSSFGTIPQTPLLDRINDDCSITLKAEEGFTEYYWYLDDVLVGTTEDNFYTTFQTGNYKVQVLRDCGLSNQSLPFFVEVIPCFNFGEPRDLVQCLENDETTFNLTIVNNDITSDPDFIFEYFLTEEDIADGNNIESDYITDNTNGPITIWIEITHVPSNSKFVKSFTINAVDCDLVLENLPDLKICQEEGVLHTFNLKQYDTVVYNGAIGYTVEYFNTEDDATDNVNAIDNTLAGAYSGTNGEIIWVRVTNDSDPSRFGVTSFKLFIFEKPASQTLTALSSCNVGGMGTFNLSTASAQASGGLTSLEVTFYPTQALAEDGNPAFLLPETYTGPAGTIWVRVANTNTGCYRVLPLQLNLVSPPQTNDLAPLQYCDANNDGFGTFNLEPTKFLVAGNPLPANVVVSYHETLSDAQNNFNRILDINQYNNIVVNEQTIYIRVGYNNSSCYSIEELQLIVNGAPVITPISNIRLCDIGNNNVELFNLRVVEPLLMADLTGYTVTYHTTQANAINGSPSIGNPGSFSNSVSNTVFIRVTNNATGCYVVTVVSLVLDPVPFVANPLPTLYKCDVNGDGFETFDLASQIPSIVGNQQGLSVTFHYTNANAQSGTSPLSLNYQNVSPNVQTIYVRVYNPSTGCYVVSTMDLRVKANPVLNIPAEPYVICSSSGFGTINLTNYGQALINQTGQLLQFNFYETESNALNELAPIATPNAYNNLNPNNPVVWIRVEDPLSECFSVYPLTFQLVVPPALPQSLPTLEVCDTLGDTQNGLSVFDLTQQNAAMLAVQSGSAADYIIRYYTSETLANQGTTWIASPTTYQNTANPQVIWVRIDHASKPGSCYRIMSFEIKVNLPTVLTHPTPIVQCDDSLPNDGKSIFDLTSRESQILPAQSINTVVKYYLSQQDAQNDINVIGNPLTYENISNPQTIHVAVTNQWGCKSYTTLTIRVLPLPDINTAPAVLEECESDLGGGTAQFDLNDIESSLSNFGDYSYLYFNTEEAALLNVPGTEISPIEGHLSGSAVIYVRVTTNPSNEAEQCAIVVPLELRVNPKPAVGPMTPFLVCEDPFDGLAIFDLHQKDAEALAGAPASDFTVTYYRTQEDADNKENAVSYIFTIELPNEQPIFVRVENNTTGCFTTADFILKVEQKVYAFPPVSSEFCETDYENDGTTIVDLTVMDADIIGTQVIPAADLSVRYYRQNGTLIGDPSNAQVNEGEVLIAEVYHDDPAMLCTASVEVTITLKDAPVVLPLKDGIICYEYREGGELISGHYLETGLPSTGYTFVWLKNGAPITADDADLLEGGSRIYVKRPGTYTVTVTGSNGCTTTRSAVVQQAPGITIDEVILTDSFGDTNAIEVIAYAGSGVVLEYKLDEGPWQDSNIFLDVTQGEHIVYVRAKAALSCPISEVVMIMDYPKYFTPNNDGYNDTWNIWSLKNQPKAKVYIFDRFGKLIKQLSPAGEGWDGTFNGQPLPSTDYWFKADYIDPKTGLTKEVRGHFSLKR